MHVLACGTPLRSLDDVWWDVQWWNTDFCDDIWSVTTPPSIWGGVCGGWDNGLLLTTSSFFFFSFLSSYLEIHIGPLNFFICHLIYISTLILIFFIFNSCSWPFSHILICFQCHHIVHNCDLLFFSNIILILLILIFLDCLLNLVFLFNFTLQFKILSCLFIYF
jgi:hypothetical protein